ncbi:hypothetical protein ACFWZ2_00580 [Streptomyces sp. NPDC059002]|uniref:hypothetical protein n=1 Tax=Streptomyces sp. NPDC059002 TaxID=3346690 RepID=UPI0036BCFE2D
MKYAPVSGIAALAVLVGALAGPAAATQDAAAATAPRTAVTAAATPRPTLTAQATESAVRASQQFRIFGTARHMPPGTPVTLQQRQGSRWVDLPATVNTTPQGTYTLRVVLDFKGRNSLRIVGGGAVSPIVYVTVHHCPIQGC